MTEFQTEQKNFQIRFSGGQLNHSKFWNQFFFWGEGVCWVIVGSDFYKGNFWLLLYIYIFYFLLFFGEQSHWWLREIVNADGYTDLICLIADFMFLFQSVHHREHDVQFFQ